MRFPVAASLCEARANQRRTLSGSRKPARHLLLRSTRARPVGNETLALRTLRLQKEAKKTKASPDSYRRARRLALRIALCAKFNRIRSVSGQLATGRVRPTGGLLECALPARRVRASSRRFGTMDISQQIFVEIFTVCSSPLVSPLCSSQSPYSPSENLQRELRFVCDLVRALPSIQLS